MTAPRKLLVIGNCQARPLLSMLESTGLFLAMEPIISHQAKVEECEKYIELLENADVILTQKTDSAFHVPIIASTNIVENFGGKALVWPNLFFGGQQPFLRYFTHAAAGRLLGPLEAMHDLRIFSEWRNTRDGIVPADELEAQIDISRINELGLRNLVQREVGCDVIVSDLIEDHLNEIIFFTFNHPSKFLLKRIAERLLVRLGCPACVKEPQKEPLAMYKAPSTWMKFEGEPQFRGREVKLDDNGQVKLGPFRHYSWIELRSVFFDCYQHYSHLLEINKIRVTPNYPGQNLDGPFSR